MLVCGFYDEVKGVWDTEGCRTVSISAFSATCECTHLTDFTLFDAPLRQIKNTYRQGTRNIVRRWQRSVTIVIVLGLICSVFFWSMLRRQWTQERDKFYLVESIRATPFYWDVIDRFEANLAATHANTQHGISKRTESSGRGTRASTRSRMSTERERSQSGGSVDGHTTTAIGGRPPGGRPAHGAGGHSRCVDQQP
jgi:multidrug efflux pump subunit AcrB